MKANEVKEMSTSGKKYYHTKGGAAAGAAIGSVFPGAGNAIGAAIGGVVGGVAGYLSGDKIMKQIVK